MGERVERYGSYSKFFDRIGLHKKLLMLFGIETRNFFDLKKF